MSRPDRVVEHLNRSLHALFDRDERLFLLGEDVADPYGGAFKVTRGLSTRFPERVVSTPISEAGILGVAGGLALCGDRVIVEMMFGDFAALGFDQLLNFATKSVSMYGRHNPMSIVLRCPVGGHRGYGPTHSQSLQKHFIGVPHLWLYELSAFHDAGALLERALDRGEPAVLFEPKSLYGRRVRHDGYADATFAVGYLGPRAEWARCHVPGATGPYRVVVAPGGTADAALAAAGDAVRDGLRVEVLVGARLYPLDLDPVLDLLMDAESVVVAEEGTEGGTWGGEVAGQLYRRGWHRLRNPVTLLHSQNSVIPAAAHLERQVLLQPAAILAALRAPLDAQRRVVAPPVQPPGELALRAVPVGVPPGAGSPDPPEDPAPTGSIGLRVPKLNSNDTAYTLVGWLLDDGAPVTAGHAVAEVETSKAVEELVAPAAGVLRHLAPVGTDCRPGDLVARVLAGAATAAAPAGAVKPGPATDVQTTDPRVADRQAAGAGGVDAQTDALAGGIASPGSAPQPPDGAGVPVAFVAVRIRADLALDAVRAPGRPGTGAIAGEGLAELTVRAVAGLREAFPMCFASLAAGHRVRVAEGARVRLTVDVNGEPVTTVIPDAADRPLDHITDDLVAAWQFPVRPAAGPSDREDANAGVVDNTGNIADITQTENIADIALSWRHEPDIVLLQPMLPPGLACAIAVAGPDEAQPAHTVVGLAHDHRLVNGREAADFLARLKAVLEDRDQLAELAKR